jgi:effector-binding domain-containing protein
MEIRSTNERDSMAIRTSTPLEKLPEVMGACYAEIMQYLGPAGIRPAGPPFAIYHNMDMSSLDVEIGFPVAAAEAGAAGAESRGRIKPGKIPGGKAAVAVHTGPYAKLGETYDRLLAFVKEQGLETESYCYEFYLNDPDETPPGELETEIFFPVKE